PESPVLWGDVNGDGEVDWADLFLLLDHLNDPSVVVAPGADVNGDGDVDWADLFLLLDHLNDPSVVLGPQ
ncbi:MAG: dockerin type I repeat-containing protein, partial [Oscillospiraceae bacterium]|nr:dockerin type I repeat-containing protein [Oscillospiraceae bacterium]